MHSPGKYGNAHGYVADERPMSVVRYKGQLFYYHPEYGYLPVQEETDNDTEEDQWAADKSQFYYQWQNGVDRRRERDSWENLESVQMPKRKRKKKTTLNKSKKRMNNFLKEKKKNQKSVKRKKKIVSRKKTKGKRKAKETKTKKKERRLENKENGNLKNAKSPKKTKKKIRPKSKARNLKKAKRAKIKSKPKKGPLDELDAKFYERPQNEKSFEVVTGYQHEEFGPEAPAEKDPLEKSPSEDLGNLEELDLVCKESNDAPEESKKDSRSFREDEYEQKLLSMGAGRPD